MNVQHRHLLLEDQWLHAHTNPQCWTPFFNPVLDLPVRVLLQFLRLGLKPLVPEDRAAYCSRLSTAAVLSDHLMQPSISRPGYWATALDNIPRRLLQQGGFGLSAGVLASRRQAWLGVPSLSTMPVQYGIYKGKTPNDRKKPHKPNDILPASSGRKPGHRFRGACGQDHIGPHTRSIRTVPPPTSSRTGMNSGQPS